MSRLISNLMNAGPRLLLASPAHRLVSNRWATLHFVGRRSGNRYHLPVAYIADGDRITISTDSGWWHNIADGQPFAVKLRGRRRKATATRLHGEDAIGALRRLVAVPGYATAAGIRRDNGQVSDAELARAADERVVLTIDLEVRR